MNTALTLSWVYDTNLPIILEEIREHSESEEDVSINLDIDYTIEKSNEEFVYSPYRLSRLSTGYVNSWSNRTFIPDHYSPPEI